MKNGLTRKKIQGIIFLSTHIDNKSNHNVKKGNFTMGKKTEFVLGMATGLALAGAAYAAFKAVKYMKELKELEEYNCCDCEECDDDCCCGEECDCEPDYLAVEHEECGCCCGCEEEAAECCCEECCAEEAVAEEEKADEE